MWSFGVHTHTHQSTNLETVSHHEETNFQWELLLEVLKGTLLRKRECELWWWEGARSWPNMCDIALSRRRTNVGERKTEGRGPWKLERESILWAGFAQSAERGRAVLPGGSWNLIQSPGRHLVLKKPNKYILYWVYAISNFPLLVLVFCRRLKRGRGGEEWRRESEKDRNG